MVPRLHVLLLTDNRDEAGKAYWQANRDHLKKILVEGFVNRPHRLDLKVPEDDKSTLEDLVGPWRGKVKPEDTVLVYYAGRSETTEKDRLLFLGQDKVGLVEIRTALLTLKPRQVVLLTDSLQNPEPGLKPLTTAALGDGLVSLPLKASWPVVDALFFHHRGLSEIHAFQEDVRWLCTDRDKKPQGSIFSLTLVPLLCQKMEYFSSAKDVISWPEFAGFLKKDAEKLTGAKTKKILSQQPAAPESKPWHVVSKQPEMAPQKILEKTWLFGAEFTEARLNGKPAIILLKVYPKTPAAEAGLQAQDIILGVGSKAMTTREELVRAIEYSEGEIEVAYRRQGENNSKKIKLRSVKPPPQ